MAVGRIGVTELAVGYRIGAEDGIDAEDSTGTELTLTWMSEVVVASATDERADGVAVWRMRETVSEYATAQSERLRSLGQQ